MPGGRKKRPHSLLAQSKQLVVFHEQRKKQLKLQRTNDQRTKLRAERRVRIPYRRGQRILLLGEGNFSFTHSLSQLIGGADITATTYDSHENMTAKYDDAAAHVAAAIAANVTIKYDFDATQMHATAHTDVDDTTVATAADTTRPYERIVFNFPHTGCGITDTAANNLVHRQFLANVFSSVASSGLLLGAKSGGQLHVTLKRGEPYESWNIVAVSRTVPRLRLLTKVPFVPSAYPLYAHRRTIGHDIHVSNADNIDIAKGAVTYIFVIDDVDDAKAIGAAAASRRKDDGDDDNEDTIKLRDAEDDRETRRHADVKEMEQQRKRSLVTLTSHQKKRHKR